MLLFRVVDILQSQNVGIQNRINMTNILDWLGGRGDQAQIQV